MAFLLFSSVSAAESHFTFVYLDHFKFLYWAAPVGWSPLLKCAPTMCLGYMQTTSDFLEGAAERGIKVLTTESFTRDPRQQVRNLKVCTCCLENWNLDVLPE